MRCAKKTLDASGGSVFLVNPQLHERMSSSRFLALLRKAKLYQHVLCTPKLRERASSPSKSLNVAVLSVMQMSTEVEVKTKSSHPYKQTNNHELDKEKSIMLERICQLQKKHAKKNEKIDFLEEHNHTLVEEITKKNKYDLKEASWRDGFTRGGVTP